jgi:protein required for attachment to host cells
MVLVLVANAAICRLYHYQPASPATLTLIQALDQPENRLKTSDMVSDKQGHYKGGVTGRGAYSPTHEAKEIHIDNFARDIARLLHETKQTQAYEKCIVILPPQLDGLFSKHLDKTTHAFITKTIQKDIVDMPTRELLEFLKINAKYVNEK